MRTGGPTMFGWLAAVVLLCGGAAAQEAAEKFVPAPEWSRPTLVELQAEATVSGVEIRLRDVARWSEADRLALDVTGDLIIERFAGAATARQIDLAQVKTVLEGAGVHLGAIRFHGAMACQVKREKVAEKAPEMAASNVAVTITPVIAGGSTPVEPPATLGAAPADKTRTLRELITTDICERFHLTPESLQIQFNPKDEALLNLAEPAVRFQIQPRRQRNIGNMAWDVTAVGESGKQTATISANVRAWQTQVVMARPVAFRQMLTEADLAERRVLLDQVPDEAPLVKEQALGQQAGRDLSPGTVLNGRMIEAVQLVRVGELMMVAVERGRVHVKWVAEARENGCRGQTIRVRKPQTREEFMVVITGPQEGKLSGGHTADYAATGSGRVASNVER